MNAQANMLSIKATEQELERAYADLRRLLQTGRIHDAVRQATQLAINDEKALWTWFRAYAAVDTDRKEAVRVLDALKVLSEAWQLDNHPIYLAHTIIALINSPKGDSAAKYLP